MKLPVSFFSPFTDAEKNRIRESIVQAESLTSGEIRVHVETRSVEDIMEHAKEWFERLKLYETKDRNGILIYLNIPMRKVAVWGDEGIHAKVSQDYWHHIIAQMTPLLKTNQLTESICLAVNEVGMALSAHFPHAGLMDKNELKDDLSVGE